MLVYSNKPTKKKVVDQGSRFDWSSCTHKQWPGPKSSINQSINQLKKRSISSDFTFICVVSSTLLSGSAWLLLLCCCFCF